MSCSLQMRKPRLKVKRPAQVLTIGFRWIRTSNPSLQISSQGSLHQTVVLLTVLSRQWRGKERRTRQESEQPTSADSSTLLPLCPCRLLNLTEFSHPPFHAEMVAETGSSPGILFSASILCFCLSRAPSPCLQAV